MNVQDQKLEYVNYKKCHSLTSSNQFIVLHGKQLAIIAHSSNSSLQILMVYVFLNLKYSSDGDLRYQPGEYSTV